MRTIRPITIEEMDDFITIFANAYPGLSVFGEDKRLQFRKRLARTFREPGVSSFALFEDGEMRGIMRLYDFTMNFLSTRALVGGVGSVAVDLLHKKEKVAADMLRYFLQYYKQKGACLTVLYPFRPDFYRRMGFGYGTKRDLYRVRPSSFPKGPSHANLTFLTGEDREALKACYHRFMSRKNGLIEKFGYEWNELFTNPELHIIGIKRQQKISGYLVYKFVKGHQGHFLNNDILVRELVYDSAEDLLELTYFIHRQADQIDRVLFYTQDEFFHYLLKDPRNDSGNLLPQVYHETNAQGVGIMYRVIDIPRLFSVLKNHNFGNVTCSVKIDLQDSFFPENAGETVINFRNGQASITKNRSFDVEVKLDISEFSSLIVGAINFKTLVEYGLAAVSDFSIVDYLNRLFAAPKPMCFTEF